MTSNCTQLAITALRCTDRPRWQRERADTCTERVEIKSLAAACAIPVCTLPRDLSQRSKIARMPVHSAPFLPPLAHRHAAAVSALPPLPFDFLQQQQRIHGEI